MSVLYAVLYVPSTPALTLLGGAVVGQGMAFGADWELHNSKSKILSWFGLLIVSFLIVCLTWASLHTGAGRTYEYRGQPRWFGVWDNPNIFGLLMATGVVLALGTAATSLNLLSGINGKWICALLCFLAAIHMGRGLLHSYSRGAWVGTVCGLAYLAVYGFGGFDLHQVTVRQAWISRFKKCRLPFSVVLLSMLILAFWHFRGTDWHPAQRAFSSVNAADFSWRNRIAAWEGALQITAEHPLLGTAWGQPEPLYEHYYLPPKLTERGAFELNDYLMLGATLGIPALFCFSMYIWLSLKGKAESRKQKAEIQEAGWLRTVCHASAIVLLIGFWFDGGLFKLPTGATFWILLELGNVRNRETNEALEHE
jgi:O-antigen ligase